MSSQPPPAALPQYIEESVLNAIVKHASSTTTSHQALQQSSYSLHEIISSAGHVFATLRIPPSDHPGYNRLLGRMSSDKETPSWLNKLARLKDYCGDFEYTHTPLRIIPSSDSVVPQSDTERGRSRTKITTPKSSSKRRKNRPATPTTTNSVPPTPTLSSPLPSRTPYVPTKPLETLDPVQIGARAAPEVPETSSPPQPPTPPAQTPNVTFSLPSPLPQADVPNKLHNSPYGPALNYPRRGFPPSKKTFSKRKIMELCHPTNFSHIRTCEACRLKAKAAAANNPKHPYHRYARSLSPNGKPSPPPKSRSRSLPPSPPAPKPTYDVRIKTLSSDPRVIKQGWVKAVLYWERSILSKTFYAWATVPARVLVQTISAVEHYSDSLLQKCFVDGLKSYELGKIQTRENIQMAVTFWWITFMRKHVRAWYTVTHRPIEKALTDRIRNAFNYSLMHLTSTPFYLLCWCSQLHFGYRLSSRLQLEDEGLVEEIMRKYFRTASVVVVKLWRQYIQKQVEIREFANYQRKKRAIRLYIDFTFRGFRDRHKTGVIQDRSVQIAKVNTWNAWKHKLKRQLLLRNSLFLYVALKAKLAFWTWKKDVFVCKAFDSVKNNVATRVVKNTLNKWMVEYVKMRQLSVIFARTRAFQMRMLVLPAFAFLKKFRIKSIKFKRKVLINYKRNIVQRWRAFTKFGMEQKSLLSLAATLQKTKMFRRFTATTLEMSRRRLFHETQIYEQRKRYALKYFSFWHKLAARRAWWHRSKRRQNAFRRRQILQKSWRRLKQLSAGKTALRKKFERSLESMHARLIMDRYFSPWRKYTARSIDIKYHLRRRQERRDYDMIWLGVRTWRDWCKHRKEARRKAAFLLLRTNERRRKSSFQQFRVSFLWHQVFRVVVNKRDEILVKRCWSRFRRMVSFLKRGRKRAEIKFEDRTKTLLRSVLSPWRLFAKRRVVAHKNYEAVVMSHQSFIKNEFFRSWLTAQAAQNYLTDRFNKVRRLHKQRVMYGCVALWKTERVVHARARLHFVGKMLRTVFACWKAFAEKSVKKNKRNFELDEFANKRTSRRFLSNLRRCASERLVHRQSIESAVEHERQQLLFKYLEKLCEKTKDKILANERNKIADEHYLFRSRRISVSRWTAFTLLSVRTRRDQRQVDSVNTTRAFARLVQHTANRMKAYRNMAAAKRFYEVNAKQTFMDRLQAATYASRTERVNVKLGDTYYSERQKALGAEMLSTFAKLSKASRRRRRAMNELSSRHSVSRMMRVTFRPWVKYLQTRRQKKAKRSIAAAAFARSVQIRALKMMRLHRLECKEARHKKSAASEHWRLALLSAALGSLTRATQLGRDAFGRAVQFNELNVKRNIFHALQALIMRIHKLEAFTALANPKAERDFCRLSFSKWREVARRASAFDTFSTTVGKVVTQKATLITFRSLQRYCITSKRVSRMMRRQHMRTTEMSWSSWLKYCALSKAQKAKSAAVVELVTNNKRVAFLKTLRRFLVDRRRIRTIEKSLKLNLGARTMERWKDHLASRQAFRDLLLDRRRAFSANKMCRVGLLRIYNLLVARCFTSLSVYRYYRQEVKRKDTVAFNFSARWLVFRCMRGWKREISNIRCLKLCDMWRGARMARVGVHKWKSWTEGSKRLRSLMSAGAKFQEERSCEEFFSRAGEYTRLRKEEKARQASAADFAEWRMKVLAIRRIRDTSGRRRLKRALTKRATEHYSKMLQCKCLLVWSRAVGISRNASARARAMSETVYRREVVLVFRTWARYSRGAGQLTRASRAVKEARRQRRLEVGLKRWRALVERRTLQRSFAQVSAEVNTNFSSRLGFAAFFTNWKRLRTNDELLADYLAKKRKAMLTLIVGAWKKWQVEMKALELAMYRKMKMTVQGRCFKKLEMWTFKAKHKKFRMKIAEEFWRQRKGQAAISNFKRHTRLRLASKLLLSEGLAYHESEMMRAGVAGLTKTWQEGKRRKELARKVGRAVAARTGRTKEGVFWAWHDWAKASIVERSMNLMASGFMMSALLKQVITRWSRLVRKRIRVARVGRVLEERRTKATRWRILLEWKGGASRVRGTRRAIRMYETCIVARCLLFWKERVRIKKEAVKVELKVVRFIGRRVLRMWVRATANAKRGRKMLMIGVIGRWRVVVEQILAGRRQAEELWKRRAERLVEEVWQEWRERVRGWGVAREKIEVGGDWRKVYLLKGAIDVLRLSAEGRKFRRAGRKEAAAFFEEGLKRKTWGGWRFGVEEQVKQKKVEMMRAKVLRGRELRALGFVFETWVGEVSRGRQFKFKVGLEVVCRQKIESWEQGRVRRGAGVEGIMKVMIRGVLRGVLAKWRDRARTLRQFEIVWESWKEVHELEQAEGRRLESLAADWRLDVQERRMRSVLGSWEAESRKRSEARRVGELVRANVERRLEERAWDGWKGFLEERRVEREAGRWHEERIMSSGMEFFKAALERRRRRGEEGEKRRRFGRTVRNCYERGVERKVFEEWREFTIAVKLFRRKEMGRWSGLKILGRVTGRLERRRLSKGFGDWARVCEEEVKEEKEKGEFMRVKWGLREWRRGLRVGRDREERIKLAEEWRVFKACGGGLGALKENARRRKRARELGEILGSACRRVLMQVVWSKLETWRRWGRAIKRGAKRRGVAAVRRSFEEWRVWGRRRGGGRGVVEVLRVVGLRRGFFGWVGWVERIKKEEAVAVMGGRAGRERAERLARGWYAGARRRADLRRGWCDGVEGVLERGLLERNWGRWEGAVILKERGRKELRLWSSWAKARRKARRRLARRAVWADEFWRERILKRAFGGIVAWWREGKGKASALARVVVRLSGRRLLGLWKERVRKAAIVENLVKVLWRWRRWHVLHDASKEEREWRESFGEVGRVWYMWKERVERMCERDKENWDKAVRHEEREMMKKAMFGFELGRL
ncbi:hypothetical protein TrST_g1398 [Triparma strigata]|uniref:Sfi1 spindle body domain-containing protein n=1 Tax=Triparma strigata TaxID=1606541 RepID=A0A9W7AGX8_9STRA|nr:hypothetical protein TrST_g1398 [Triparma strigata]